MRDANTATEDLQLLLDADVMHAVAPFAGLLISCNSRGERLFGEPNHDLNIIRRRFGGDMPLAGFFAAGEFGPIAGRSFLHGHTWRCCGRSTHEDQSNRARFVESGM